MDKKALIKQFQQDPHKYWKVKLFDELGFKRRQCKKCGKFFWTLTEQEICNDSSCRPYEFIENPPTNKKYDYFKAWDAIKRFFVQNNHVLLDRYPVVCRWFPLYFTIAGIVDFYRMDNSKFVFEFPANPVVLLQPSLRFNDIPNVGTGRHWTCHSHVEQACINDGKNGYWKDRCIELDFELLTKVFGIKPELINFIEDAWLGPGAFGYSLEYHVKGLELGNAVFTEFSGTPDNFQKMAKPVIDMGAGLERFCWISQGSPTSYDAVLGPVIEKMKSKASIEYDKDFFLKYSKLSGLLNIDEVANIEIARAQVTKQLGVTKAELAQKIEPMQAIYAIVDHARALTFALTDGGIPSNLGGGYNLRVILRRALSFIDKYNFPFDLIWVTEKVAKYFKPLHPELIENIGKINEILNIEEKRYEQTRQRVGRLVESLVKTKTEFTEQKLIELYDSQGITPELIQETVKERDLTIEIPADFYAKVTERHMLEKPEKEKKIDIKGLPETKKLFHEKIYEFDAKVLKIIDNKFVILDKTAFYPRGGGQEPDFGLIESCKVFDAESYDGIIAHSVENPNFKQDQIVKCKIDLSRRKQITQHHSATHIINAASRQVLGAHIWQAGSKKDIDKAHLDVTHYQALTETQVEKIETKANQIINKNIKIKKEVIKRPEAEAKYGFRIYQGAAVPLKELRIVSIGDVDREACGGIHCDSTEEIGQIIIIKTEKPQDGIVRLVYVAGPAAEKYLQKRKELLNKSAQLLKVSEKKLPEAVKKLFENWKKKKKELEKLQEKTAKEKMEKLEFEEKNGLKFLIREVPKAGPGQLREISRKLSSDNTIIFLFGISDKIYIFASAGEKAVKGGIDVGKIVKEACAELSGRGGGLPNLAQGFGTNKNKLKNVIENIKKSLVK